jgi:WD40 repeat protein
MAVVDLRSGETVARVPLTGGTLEAVALGPQGKLLSFEFGTIFFSSEESAPTKTPGSVWSIEQNARLFSLPLMARGSQGPIHVISDDGRLFARTALQGRIEFWSTDQRKIIGHLEQPGGTSSVSIYASKSLAASVNGGGDIRVWRIGSDEPPRWLHVKGSTTQIVFSHDGDSIFVAGGSLVQKLDIRTGAVLSTASVVGELKHVGGEHMHATARMAVAGDRDVLLASFGRQIRLYKNTIAETGVLVGHRYHNPTSYVGFSRDGTRLIESTMDALRIYDARTLSHLSAPRIGERSSNKVGNTSLGLFPEWIYGPGSENGLVAFKVSSENFVESFPDRVAVGSVNSLAPHQSIKFKGYSVWGATVSLDGNHLAASLVPFGPLPRRCDDHMVTVRSLVSGGSIEFCGARIGHHASPAIGPNTEALAFVTQEGKLSILDVRSRTQRRVEGIFNPFGQPVFSNNGMSLFMPRGRSILEVNVSNGSVLRTFPVTAKGGIKSISISRDGEWLASADLKGVRIWSVASGLILQSIEGPWEPNMSNGAFDANADRIVFGSSFWNRVVRVYKDPDATMARARKAMPGCLSEESRLRMGLQSGSPSWCADLGNGYRLPELN